MPKRGIIFCLSSEHSGRLSRIVFREVNACTFHFSVKRTALMRPTSRTTPDRFVQMRSLVVPWIHGATRCIEWSYEWAGYKYHFNICCTGNNIETITYEIEGERSYFEIIDNTVTPEQQQSGVHIFHYPKTVTFDYEHQESISDDRIVEIYIGFPLSQSGLDAYHRFWAEGNSAEISDQINKVIEEGAARELIGSVLSVTATFTDGSTQTKSYLIEASDFNNSANYTFTEIAIN